MTASDCVTTRFERTWLVLSKLFEELVANGIIVDAAKLRDSKSLLHLVRTTPYDPCAVPVSGSKDPLTVLEESLERAKAEMISASLKLGQARAKGWLEKVAKAELDDTTEQIAYGESHFFSGLPKDRTVGWARLSLQQPVGEGRVQDVAEQFGVLVEFEDDLHLVFEGEPFQVKKALADVYYLSQP